MLSHLCGPENRDAYNAAVEALAKVIHEGDWALGGSNVGKGATSDWRWSRASRESQRRAYAKAEAVLRSDELVEILLPGYAAAWREGLNAIGTMLTQPLRDDGTRAPVPNPYEPRQTGESS